MNLVTAPNEAHRASGDLATVRVRSTFERPPAPRADAWKFPWVSIVDQGVAHSRTCDRGPGITRERVKGRSGTKTYPTDFPCPVTDTQQTIGRRLYLLGEVFMSSAFYRAERCRDLAEECRRVPALCTSTEMRRHYSLLSEHYSTLAETEELGALALRQIRQFDSSGLTDGVSQRKLPRAAKATPRLPNALPSPRRSPN